MQVNDLLARELVPGDVVDLTVGDKVPADMRVIELKTATMRLIQASLTGESEPVNKSVEAVSNPECEIQEKTSMLFAGTAVANGHCLGGRRFASHPGWDLQAQPLAGHTRPMPGDLWGHLLQRPGYKQMWVVAAKDLGVAGKGGPIWEGQGGVGGSGSQTPADCPRGRWLPV